MPPLHTLKTVQCPPPLAPPTLPTPSNPSPNPTTQLNDALTIRRKVFIDEQGCCPSTEIDADDPRSWHWVVYSSRDTPEYPTIKPNLGEEATGHGDEALLAMGTLRLVPPPHAPHCPVEPEIPDATTETTEGTPKYEPHGQEHGHEGGYDMLHEPYVKLTRVAVLPEYRGKGIARRLVETAVDWARQHPGELQAADDRVRRDVYGDASVSPSPSANAKWKGLVLVHAQVSVEGMYARLGFETDEGMGRWDEEGIEHVGMWMKLKQLK